MNRAIRAARSFWTPVLLASLVFLLQPPAARAVTTITVASDVYFDQNTTGASLERVGNFVATPAVLGDALLASRAGIGSVGAEIALGHFQTVAFQTHSFSPDARASSTGFEVTFMGPDPTVDVSMNVAIQGLVFMAGCEVGLTVCGTLVMFWPQPVPSAFRKAWIAWSMAAEAACVRRTGLSIMKSWMMAL